MFLAQLCRTNKIYVSATVYTVLSQFSDPEGQRFEFSRSHQEQHLMGCCSFCFAWILWSSKRADSNSPCPALCVPRGRNAPVGRFYPAAWRIPSGTLKKRIAMYFCNALFGLMLFWFQNHFPLSGKMILLTKKKMTIDTPPFKTVVPML